MIHEITYKKGVRTERWVNYKTGEVFDHNPNNDRIADAWVEHWSESMGARTPQHAREIAERCQAAGMTPEFKYGTHGPLKVNSTPHQRKLGRVAHADQGVMRNFDSYYG